MTDLEKAARMALEALEKTKDENTAYLDFKEPYHEAITALRQALSSSVEQPAQQSAERVEPVDWEAVAADQAMTIAMMKAERKPWVGLTDEEIARVVSLAGFAPDWAEANIATQIVRVCQDMLKRKNT